MSVQKQRKKRADRIEIRVNEEEKKRLENAADRAKLSVSEFIRDWVKKLPEN